MRDHIRHEGAGKGVQHEHAGHHHQRRAERAAGGLEQDRHAGDGDDQVKGGGVARAAGQLHVKNVQVGRAEGAHQADDPVLNRDVIARRGTESGIGQERQQHGERQVDGARLGVVEDEYVECERQWRGIPQLEQRPRQRNEKQQRGGNLGGGRARPGVGFGDQRLGGVQA